MPRKVRELEDGGIYHVFNRGNDRRNLFQDEEDYQFFLSRLLLVKQEFGSEIYHYCLMTNHFHMLMRIKKGNDLSKLMHRSQLAFARYFKKKYEFIGHVFQERFRSPKIHEESYFLQCGRYIERNSVRAGLVKDPWQYPYSSARFYGLGKTDSLVTPNPYYEELGSSDEERKTAYRKFLSIEEPYGAIVDLALTKV